ncbi:MAG: pilus assembly protein [Sphingomonadales bacterium]|nr:MAG: pilus assembly protein [Sphingomonadales bacterium]
MIARGFRRLRRDQRGATIVEFAIVAPVMGMVLLGAFDVAHSLYMRGVLQGIVQKTARDSTLEDSTAAATQTALDNKVKAQVSAIANSGTITFTRRYYRTFSTAAAARAETFTDSSAGIFRNGVCDNGEPYEDANLNGVWDRDGGNSGQGGAKDAVLYTVTVTYPRFFPIYRFIGGSTTTKITGSTVLRNQPYGDQSSYATMQVRNCP